jgi:hypothetical protein
LRPGLPSGRWGCRCVTARSRPRSAQRRWRHRRSEAEATAVAQRDESAVPRSVRSAGLAAGPVAVRNAASDLVPLAVQSVRFLAGPVAVRNAASRGGQLARNAASQVVPLVDRASAAVAQSRPRRGWTRDSVRRGAARSCAPAPRCERRSHRRRNWSWKPRRSPLVRRLGSLAVCWYLDRMGTFVVQHACLQGHIPTPGSALARH